MSYSVIFQLDQDSQGGAKALISQTRNAIKDLPGLQVEWVIHGKAVHFLRSDKCLKNSQMNDIDSTINSSFCELSEKYDVRILACKNALISQQIEEGQLLKQAVVIPSGVGHIIKRQAEGWSYIKVVR